MALRDISEQNPRYIEDMTQVFNKCQDREAERLIFFRDTMFILQKCLNVSADPAYVPGAANITGPGVVSFVDLSAFKTGLFESFIGAARDGLIVLVRGLEMSGLVTFIAAV